MKTKSLLWFLLLNCLIAASQNNSKIIGYLPTYKFHVSAKIDYSKLTHLNIAFANPNASGDIIISDFSKIVADAKGKNPNIKILVSLAGGGLNNTLTAKYWSNYIDVPTNRPGFITKIVDFVNRHNLDGVDIDLESKLITTGYSDFIIELNTALDVHNKLLTAAFPKTYYKNVTQKALETFDFINIMAYDAHGFWGTTPAQHSSYAYAEENITFWKTVGGLSAEKLVLGVPFYGHNFDTRKYITYGQMVALNPANADIDNVQNTFYNGRTTIQKKVELAYNQASGIMIWELGQDSFTEYSLLTAIHKKYTNLAEAERLEIERLEAVRLEAEILNEEKLATRAEAKEARIKARAEAKAERLATRDAAKEARIQARLQAKTETLANNEIAPMQDFKSQMESISVFPNPATNGVINYNTIKNFQSIKIFNKNGQEINNIAFLENNSIDISQIQSGVYNVVFYTTDGVISKRIIKE